MEIQIIETSDRQAAECAAFSAAREALGRKEAPTVIAPSYDETVRLKTHWAHEGSFGVEVSTLDAWVQDAWELYGDGRTIVSAVQRQLLVGAALEEACAEGAVPSLQPTAGTRKFLAQIAREALPSAVPNGELARSELEAVGVLDRYRRLLDGHGLIEYAQAVAVLADEAAEFLSKPILLGARIDRLIFAERRLLERVGAVFVANMRNHAPHEGREPELAALLDALFAPDEDHPVEATGAVRFVLPSGRYAAPAALAAQIIERAADDRACDIVVACRDAHGSFAEIAPRLAARGIPSQVRGTLPFSGTEFGSAWLALLEVVYGTSSLMARAATDFALSPYSGVGVKSAYWMDARWRANRAVDRETLLTDLCGTADHGLNGLIGSLENDRADEAFDILFAHVAKQASWPEGYRDRQLSALTTARAVYEQAVEFGVGMDGYRSVLEDQVVFTREAAFLPGACTASSASVLFVDLGQAASLSPLACDVLVATDLTAAAYPVKSDRGAIDALLEKLGAPSERDELAAMRERIYDAIAVPRRLLVLERTLNTVTADEARPAIVLEDIVDCYRSDLQNPGEVDKSTGLTPALGRFVVTRGEEGAVANLSEDGTVAVQVDEIPVMPTGFVTPAARPKILLPQQWGGMVNEGYTLSPSAIESYLECPYKWFAHRRLRLEELDAGFGGREFGLFAHKVLDRFYDRFRTDVAPKVTDELLPEARLVLASIFDEQLAYDSMQIGDPTALVALSDLERKEIDDLKRKLLSYLDREARLLPGYTPLDGEVSFGRGERAFSYAGFNVNGSIDRVDVDGYGRAVVIDYKGAVGRAYAFREKPPKQSASAKAGAASGSGPGEETDPFDFTVLPRKVQTLIYAQAVRRTMGLEPVGALYLSYGKDRGTAGAFDHAAFDYENDLLGIDVATCAVRNFGEVLDRVEEAVAERLEDLLAGRIPACPRDADACTYCPVTVCSVRDAVRGAQEGGE